MPESGNNMPWQRQRNEQGKLEPMFWFSRFDRYFRAQGPERSLLQAYNLWRRIERDRDASTGTPISWTNASKQWRWWERAEAWDAEQAQLRHEEEAEERERRRSERIKQAQAAQAVGLTIIRLANIKEVRFTTDEHGKTIVEGLTCEAARQLFGEGRRLWSEGVKQERLEHGEPSIIQDVDVESQGMIIVPTPTIILPPKVDEE